MLKESCACVSGGDDVWRVSVKGSGKGICKEAGVVKDNFSTHEVKPH